MRCRWRWLVAGVILLALSGTGRANDDPDNETAIIALIAAHNAALPISFIPDPFIGQPAGAVTFGTNLALKYRPALFHAPGDRSLDPGDDGIGDECSYEFTLPQTEATFSNILGLWTTRDMPEDWGPLGRPDVLHANTDVTVTVSHPQLLAPGDGERRVVLPAGRHDLRWRAQTRISDLFDLILPIAMWSYNTGYYGAMWADQGADAVRQAARQQIVKETLKAVALEAGLIAADQLGPFGTRPTVSVTRNQRVTVYDVLDPEISASRTNFTFEATDFGGALLSRRLQELKATITARDACGRPVTLSSDAPRLLPLGTTPVKWTVTDRGPNRAGRSNTATLTQFVTVRDSQAPIMVPPPGRVLETRGGGLARSSIQLGVPRVVDLADPAPVVSSNAPEFFPVGRRTPVTWSARDSSGNARAANQWITVKKAGSNRPPSVAPGTAFTLTAKPVDVVLSGRDPDFLDGKFDPLSFSLIRRPAHGEFVAPLLPYFIDDYRTPPDGPFGEAFRLSGNKVKWVYENYCRKHIELPVDFVYRPLFIHVDDDGTHYVLDHYFWCNPSNGELDPRISKWDRDGNYLGQRSYGGTNDSFVLDRDGFIYTLTRTGAGSSTTLFLARCDTDFTTRSCRNRRGWKFDYASAPAVSPSTLIYARVDSRTGIAYVTDKNRVFAFDLSGDPGRGAVYLGTLNHGESFLKSCSAAGSSWIGFGMEIDRAGNLYVADSCAHRIHKFRGSRLDADGTFIAGAYVGWMGACTASTNKACDLRRQASRGYSCTDATCSSSVASGDGPGQFSTPLYLALDPNDILYVADYGNFRVQRFGPDGSFAGEAASTGTGINRGSRPSFVLGNMDRPKTVSVNSSQFYVVDRDESFVHVFRTTPLKDITENSARVTYVSRFDFQGVDTFVYKASDGLAESGPGVVRITVNRNFRPPGKLAIVCYRPEAPQTPVPCKLQEDTSMLVRLTADDPDGIEGVDFLGLDTLTYAVEQPAHGTMTLQAADAATATYLYAPARDFNGRDRFSFTVSDGHDTVGPARFGLRVTPVNDPPVPSIGKTSMAGRGFPMRLIASYSDVDRDPAQAPPTLEIGWGDGSRQGQGKIIRTGNGEYRANGPLLTPGEPGKGLISGLHTYRARGGRNIQVCVTDAVDGLTRCTARAIEVIDATSVILEVTASTERPRPGGSVDYRLQVTNQQPESWSGLVAAGVEVEVSIPAGMILAQAPAACGGRGAGAGLLCSLGALPPGDSSGFGFSLRADPSATPRPEQSLNASLRHAGPDVSAPQLAMVPVSVQWPDGDGDGLPDRWEQIHGLDARVPDARSDVDGDGLNNLQEYHAGTDPTRRDTDGDGLDDGEEVAQGLDPTDGSDCPDRLCGAGARGWRLHLYR